MGQFWAGVLLGAILGGGAGVLTMALLAAGKIGRLLEMHVTCARLARAVRELLEAAEDSRGRIALGVYAVSVERALNEFDVLDGDLRDEYNG